MAIEIKDFGSDVDQVQDKLNEILPQLDDGRELIGKVLGDDALDAISPTGVFFKLDGEAGTSGVYADHINNVCEKIDPDLSAGFETAKKQLDDDLKLADDADGALKSAQQTLDDELKSRQENLSEAAVAFETTMNEVQGKTDAISLELDNLDTSFESTRDLILEKVNDGVGKHNASHIALTGELDTFENDGLSTISESGTGPLTLFDDTMSDLKEEADKRIEEYRKEIDEVLDALKTDRSAITTEFCEQYKMFIGQIPGPMGELAATVVGELQDCKNNSLGNLQSEVSEAQGASEKAKALLDEVAPKISDVQDVKETAENMNQAM